MFRFCCWVVLSICGLLASGVNANDWSAEVGLESTLFTQNPAYTGQHADANFSLSVQPEYYTSWDNRDQSLEFIPYARLDYRDDERTHIDIRELAWTKVYDQWEVRAGVSRTFWGVAEFQHLIDVINQTDLVENIDGEDKLGQPMVLLTAVQDWGNVELFVLPYFRERSFPGEEGRLRTPLRVDDSLTSYESSQEESHPDFALRYSHYFGDFDIGLAHFTGTNREPLLSPAVNSVGETVLAPYYEQMEQTSIDLQATKGSMLWKLEALHRIADSDVHNAIAAGVEYSFFGISGTFADLGLLLEYHYDDRGDRATSIFEDDIALGARLAFNDEASSELLAGAIIDESSGGTAVSVEASRRITNALFLELESRFFFDYSQSDLEFALASDDFIRLNARYSF